MVKTIWNDGVAVGWSHPNQDDGAAKSTIAIWPIGRIIPIEFMVEHENRLVPKLHQHVKKWRCFGDDTFAYVENKPIMS